MQKRPPACTRLTVKCDFPQGEKPRPGLMQGGAGKEARKITLDRTSRARTGPRMHQIDGQVRFPARDSRLSAIKRIEGDRPLLSKSNLARPAGYTTEDLLQMSASGCSIFAVVYEIRRRGLRPASVSPGRDRRHLLQRVYNRRFAANMRSSLRQICGCIRISAPQLPPRGRFPRSRSAPPPSTGIQPKICCK